MTNHQARSSNDMSRSLLFFLRAADYGMIAYWVFSALACLGAFTVPLAWMYGGYGTPQVDAWNWSFMPLDIAFAALGIWSINLARRNDPRWRIVCAISLTLTMCAGGMAVSYWTIIGEFDPTWWAANLALFLLPLIWLPALIKQPATISDKDAI